MNDLQRRQSLPTPASGVGAALTPPDHRDGAEGESGAGDSMKPALPAGLHAACHGFMPWLASVLAV